MQSLLHKLLGARPADDPRSLSREDLLQLGETVDARLATGEHTLRSLSGTEKIALLAYWRAKGRGSVLGAFVHGLRSPGDRPAA